MIRRNGAAVVGAMILGCVLILLVPAKARAEEPVVPYILEPELCAEFEQLLYRYDNFWDEPYVATVSRGRSDPGSVPRVIQKDDARRDVEFLFGILKYGYAGYQFFGGDEVFLAVK